MTIHERFPFKWKQSRAPKAGTVSKPTGVIIIRSLDREIKFYLYDEFLEKEIAVLALSFRSENALRRSSVNTLKDVVNNWERLQFIRAIGVKSVTEIKSKFVDYYLEWLETHHPELNVA